MFSAPCEFDRQDEGHSAYNPRTWKVSTKYYSFGQFPYKKYGNKQILTGPFAGTQNNNKEHVMLHYKNKNDYSVIYEINHQKNWQL